MMRLKTRAQFQAVLAGTTVARTPHFALHRRTAEAAGALSSAPSADEAPGRREPPLFDGAGPWLGAMVPKRWARRAVTRNAIKRQIYQVSASFEAAAPNAAYIVRLRAGFDRTAFPSAASGPLKAAVRAELLRLFERVAAPAPAVARPEGSA
ncbi:ribonuclease P protein component [Variovorax sp.]|uniref:ribonuclease P protein component n=1 Tax=Variovorax sp. TaxID=1871043 RepID=UPI002D66B7C0|nr:ribonuclease P protein component [Variovorax sp.]HYP82813.1 ribonuclease P protein component [Variovorax sp.]